MNPNFDGSPLEDLAQLAPAYGGYGGGAKPSYGPPGYGPPGYGPPGYGPPGYGPSGYGPSGYGPRY